MPQLTKILGAAIALIVVGCVDADPFGFTRKTITGDYYLEEIEDGGFHLGRKGHQESPLGYIEGTVLELGWNPDVLAVKRQSPSSKDGQRIEADAWIAIDLNDHSISKAMSDREFRTRYSSLHTNPVEVVWNGL